MSTPPEQLQKYAGIIISGGPQSVYGQDAPKYHPALFTDYHGPILGICYGMQLLNYACGGKIEKKSMREDGTFIVKQNRKQGDKQAAASLLYTSLPESFEVLLTHGDSLSELASGFHVTAMSSNGVVASIENTEKKLYGVQFHPEVDLTPQGNVILRNFLVNICGISPTFTLQSRKAAAISEIRALTGDKSKVLCLLSGGVDSSVCAALLKEAIGADRVSHKSVVHSS